MSDDERLSHSSIATEDSKCALKIDLDKKSEEIDFPYSSEGTHSETKEEIYPSRNDGKKANIHNVYGGDNLVSLPGETSGFSSARDICDSSSGNISPKPSYSMQADGDKESRGNVSEPSGSSKTSSSVLMGLLTRRNDAPLVYPKLMAGDNAESSMRSRCYTCPTSMDMRNRPEIKQHLKNIQTSYLLDLSMKKGSSSHTVTSSSHTATSKTQIPPAVGFEPTRKATRKRTNTESMLPLGSNGSPLPKIQETRSEDGKSRKKPKKVVQPLPSTSRADERKCIVCGKDVSLEKHFTVFKKRATLSEHSIATRLSAVIGQEITPGTVHSNYLCTSCVNRIEMVEKGREMERLVRVEFKKTQALIAAEVDDSGESEDDQRHNQQNPPSSRPIGTIPPRQNENFLAMCATSQQTNIGDIMQPIKKRMAMDNILRTMMENKNYNPLLSSQSEQCKSKSAVSIKQSGSSILEQTLLGAIDKRPINIVPEPDYQYESSFRDDHPSLGERAESASPVCRIDITEGSDTSEKKKSLDDFDPPDSPVIKIEPIDDDNEDSELLSTNRYINNYFDTIVTGMPADNTVATSSKKLYNNSALKGLLLPGILGKDVKKSTVKGSEGLDFVVETYPTNYLYDAKTSTSGFVRFSCLMCGVDVQSKNGIESHVKCHLLGSKHLRCYKCSYINPKLPTQWRIMRCHLVQEHQLEDKMFGRFLCMEKDCEYMSLTQDDLTKHLFFIHGLDDVSSHGGTEHRLKSTGLFDYPCKICNTLLYSKEQLRIHMLCHGGNSKSYVCYICAYCHHSMPGSWRFMKGHLVKKHIPRDIPLYEFYYSECEHYGCKEKFATSDGRDIHMKCHMPDTDNMFYCCVCNFRQNVPAFWDTIKEHILFMHPYVFEGPFHCSCQQTFETLDSFKEHTKEAKQLSQAT